MMAEYKYNKDMHENAIEETSKSIVQKMNWYIL